MNRNEVLAGAVAGCAATAPMSLVMLALHRALPRLQRYSLPPERITARVTSALGLRDGVDRRQETALTTLAHFGYGAAAGALYGPLAAALPAPPVLSGVGFGLVVWLVSYLGWIPAAGLYRPATDEPAQRNAMMIAAHLVWGAAAGLLFHRLERNLDSDSQRHW